MVACAGVTAWVAIFSTGDILFSSSYQFIGVFIYRNVQRLKRAHLIAVETLSSQLRPSSLGQLYQRSHPPRLCFGARCPQSTVWYVTGFYVPLLICATPHLPGVRKGTIAETLACAHFL